MAATRYRSEIGPELRTTSGRLRLGKKTGIVIDNEKYPLDFARCGTPSNYRAHLRRGQEPCERCRAVDLERRAKSEKGI